METHHLTALPSPLELALSNFFERRVSAYQVGITGEVGFDEDF